MPSNRGRPSRDPTKEEKKKAKELLETGAPVADVARALGRSVPNFRKHFEKELISGKKMGAEAQKPTPPFRITKVHRDKVSRYIGGGMKKVDVARVIGCSEDELDANFPEELATGRARYRARILDKLDEQMEAGKVGATNRLEALTGVEEGTKSTKSSSYIGKKAAANAAAAAAVAGGNMFAPPAPPARLATVNGAPVKSDGAV